jgi:hypothetical protein
MTVPVSSLPRARAPGEKSCPALRIATKDDAHSTTVTPAEASASRGAWPSVAWPSVARVTAARRLADLEFIRPE